MAIYSGHYVLAKTHSLCRERRNYLCIGYNVNTCLLWYYINSELLYPEAGDGRFFRNVGTYLPSYTSWKTVIVLLTSMGPSEISLIGFRTAASCM
jgi:hypothetical protein